LFPKIEITVERMDIPEIQATNNCDILIRLIYQLKIKQRIFNSDKKIENENKK